MTQPCLTHLHAISLVGLCRLTEEYLCGDMNTSIIKTALGRTIVLQVRNQRDGTQVD